MVKPVFTDIDVDLWAHSGILGAMPPFVCIFHDDPGKGIQLLDAAKELELEGDVMPAHRTITFRNRTHRSALRTLKFKLQAVCAELKVMHIVHDRDSVTIVMTVEGLSLLKAAVATWLGGAEDFGVSPQHSKLNRNELGALDRKSGELWFWGPHYAAP